MQLLRTRAVLDKRGTSRSAHYQDMQDGRWPRPIKIGARAVAWPAHEVDALIAAQIAGQSEAQIRDLVARLEKARSKLVCEVV